MDSVGAEGALTSGDIGLNSDDLDQITQDMFKFTGADSQTQMSGLGSIGSIRPSITEPYIEIIEQPKARGLRFRYECEGRNAGSIPGESTTPSDKTYPTVQIHNHTGSAVVVISCVTKEDPPRPHPHALVGKDCGEGVCTVKTKRANIPLSFPGIGIQCAKKKELVAQLVKRESIRVDPFQTGFEHKNGPLDLTVVRLCFQVFLPDVQGKYTKILTPVVSKPIYDKKAINELNICRYSSTHGSVRGGEEVFLFTDKVNKDDLQIHFFEEDRDGVCWEAFGRFGSADVHKQVAIVFTTPAYKNQEITNPVSVQMELKRPSDGITSNPVPFTFIPASMEGSMAKRKRKYVNDQIKTEFVNDVQEVRPTAKAQMRRHILQKKSSPPLPQVKQEVIAESQTYWPAEGDYGQYNQTDGGLAPVVHLDGNNGGQQQYFITNDDPNLTPITNYLEEIVGAGEAVLQFNSSELYEVGANEDVMAADASDDIANLHKHLSSMSRS